ncbi:MAG TPA: hypothetical protein QF623_09320, partial [SAR324 cluster bacterium]|nr:hypothetical protein [SAR324 cluster bacterium]
MTEDEKVGNGGSETESTFFTGLEKEENQALREMTGDSGFSRSSIMRFSNPRNSAGLRDEIDSLGSVRT